MCSAAARVGPLVQSLERLVRHGDAVALEGAGHPCRPVMVGRDFAALSMVDGLDVIGPPVVVSEGRKAIDSSWWLFGVRPKRSWSPRRQWPARLPGPEP